MRAVIRNVLLYSFALYLTQMLLDGLVVHGGIETLLFGGLLLAIGFKILKPVISIISLPFNLLTLGFFSIFIVAFIVFLITLVYPAIEVRPFRFPGFFVMGVEIHPFDASLLLSYCIISATIYLITKFIDWLFGK